MQRTLSNSSVARVEGAKDLQEEIDDVKVEVDCAEDVPAKSGRTFIRLRKTEWVRQRADGRWTNQIQTSRQTAMERRTLGVGWGLRGSSYSSVLIFLSIIWMSTTRNIENSAAPPQACIPNTTGLQAQSVTSKRSTPRTFSSAVAKKCQHMSKRDAPPSGLASSRTARRPGRSQGQSAPRVR